MPPGLPNPVCSRAEFDQRPKRHLGRESRFKPAVFEIVLEGGRRWIVKDCAGKRTFIAHWIAVRLLRREARALTALRGLRGVPQLSAIDDDAFGSPRLNGEPMRAGNTPGGIRAIVDQLLFLLEQLSRRGVYHLDLAHKQNVLIDASGEVSLIDFGSAIRLGPWGNRLLGPFLANLDRRGALKYLARWAPHELTAEEARLLLRRHRLRRLWFFSRHAPPAGEIAVVRKRLRESQTRSTA